jgi:hypothetical protein
VRLSDGTQIPIVATLEKWQTLMNKHFMHQEVSKSINSNAHSDIKSEVISCHHAKHNTQPTWYRENQKEGIVALENMFVWFMMISVKNP